MIPNPPITASWFDTEIYAYGIDDNQIAIKFSALAEEEINPDTDCIIKSGASIHMSANMYDKPSTKGIIANATRLLNALISDTPLK